MDTKVVILVLLPLLLSSTMANQLEQTVQGNNVFGSKMYDIVAKQDGNVFMSPFSAHAVLSMAYQGAGGDTAKAFSKVLRVDAATAAEGYSEIISKLNAIKSVTLNVANALAIKPGFNVKPAFFDVILKKFHSETKEVDFAKSEAAAKTLNQWVENRTNYKIKELFKADDLNEDTRLVLMNAIYFKGSWAKKFNPDLTTKKPFYLLSGGQADVDMMYINGEFRFSENADLNAQVLELPYENRDVSMYIILPNERTGLKAVEAKVAQMDPGKLTEGMRKFDVEVHLPKFKIETTIEMNDILKEMGLGEMFDNGADFSGISSQPLKVSKVIQKAFIEVNEEGAEAAAATGLVIKIERSPPSIQVNRPFMFGILDKKTGTKLFFGRILNPNQN